MTRLIVLICCIFATFHSFAESNSLMLKTDTVVCLPNEHIEHGDIITIKSIVFSETSGHDAHICVIVNFFKMPDGKLKMIDSSIQPFSLDGTSVAFTSNYGGDREVASYKSIPDEAMSLIDDILREQQEFGKIISNDKMEMIEAIINNSDSNNITIENKKLSFYPTYIESENKIVGNLVGKLEYTLPNEVIMTKNISIVYAIPIAN